MNESEGFNSFRGIGFRRLVLNFLAIRYFPSNCLILLDL